MKGNWGMAVLATLCMFVLFLVLCFGIVIFFGQPFRMISSGNTFKLLFGIVGYIVALLALFPLIWSYNTMFLSNIRGGKISLGQLFNGYNDARRITWGYFLIALCQIIVTSIISIAILYLGGELIISQIVCYSITAFITILFSQFAYIVFDDEDISAFDALCKSMNLMNGHKLQYFILMLILVLCVILFGVITLGVGILFCLPYVATVNAHFYESLEENDEATEETDSDYKEINSNNEEV